MFISHRTLNVSKRKWLGYFFLCRSSQLPARHLPSIGAEAHRHEDSAERDSNWEESHHTGGTSAGRYSFANSQTVSINHFQQAACHASWRRKINKQLKRKFFFESFGNFCQETALLAPLWRKESTFAIPVASTHALCAVHSSSRLLPKKKWLACKNSFFWFTFWS